VSERHLIRLQRQSIHDEKEKEGLGQWWIKDGVEPKRQTGNKRKTVITGGNISFY
jgi:hypothetical protein